jgi:hypothetical protein
MRHFFISAAITSLYIISGCASQKEKILNAPQYQDIKKTFEERRSFAAQKGLDLLKKADDLTSSFTAKVEEKLGALAKNKKNISADNVEKFSLFFPKTLLEEINIVVVENIPTLGSLLEDSGLQRERLANFGIELDNEMWSFQPAAMTIGTTIYMERMQDDPLATFFHEFVHVAQYKILGTQEFLRLYVQDILAGVSYEALPFEVTAYELERRFSANPTKPFDAYQYIEQTLASP